MNKNIYCSLNLGIYMELGVLFLRSEVAQTQRVFPTGKWDPKGRSQRNISGDSPAFPLGQIQTTSKRIAKPRSWWFKPFFPRRINNSSKTDPRPHRIHGTWYMYLYPWISLIFDGYCFMLGKYIYTDRFFYGKPIRQGPSQSGFPSRRIVIKAMIRGSSSSLLGGRGHPGETSIRPCGKVFRGGFFSLRGRVKNGCVLKELILSPLFLFFVCVFIPKMTYNIHDTCICLLSLDFNICITWIYFFMFVVSMVWRALAVDGEFLSGIQWFLTFTNLRSLGD